MPISLLPTSYTFQQSKFLKTGKIVDNPSHGSIRNILNQFFPCRIRMFAQIYQYCFLLFTQLLLYGLLYGLRHVLYRCPFRIFKPKYRPYSRSVITELRCREAIVLARRNNALYPTSPCFNLAGTEERIGYAWIIWLLCEDNLESPKKRKRATTLIRTICHCPNFLNYKLNTFVVHLYCLSLHLKFILFFIKNIINLTFYSMYRHPRPHP